MATRETRLEDFKWAPDRWCARALEDDPRLRRLERWVRSRYGKPLTLAQAAERACLARCYFSTYFKRHTGVPFSVWLRCLRVQCAARHLLEARNRLEEVSWSVGYRDVSTFRRAFEKTTGESPAVFRAARLADRGERILEAPHPDGATGSAQLQGRSASLDCPRQGILVAARTGLHHHVKLGGNPATA